MIQRIIGGIAGFVVGIFVDVILILTLSGMNAHPSLYGLVGAGLPIAFMFAGIFLEEIGDMF